MTVEDRLKTALDESRLLILRVQVLFGFQFEAAFQDLFADVPAGSRYVHCAGLMLLLASMGLLSFHRCSIRSFTGATARRAPFGWLPHLRERACCR